MKNVAISLLNFNGKESTLECLRSLNSIKHENFKLTIVVVDNGSSDDSASAILNFCQKLDRQINFKFIQNEKNLGFSGGHNKAVKYALKNEADYVLILNNDTHVDKNFLAELFKVAESDNEIGILSPKIYFASGFEFHKNKYSKSELGKVLWYAGGEMDWANIVGYHRGVDEVDDGQFDKIEEIELATGCCMLIKKEVFEKIGSLSNEYFLYYEDADLSVRAKKKSYKIMYVPKSIIWHKNAGSVGGSGSALQDYYITRNRLLFGFRYAPIRSKLALFRESLRLLAKGRQWQKQGIKDFYLREFGKGNFDI
jgi:GT2 family glycosyltransferase